MTSDTWHEQIMSILEDERMRARAAPDLRGWAAVTLQPRVMHRRMLIRLPTLPEPPRPVWAVDFKVDMLTSREIIMTHLGRSTSRGRVAARAQRDIIIDIMTGDVNETWGIDLHIPEEISAGYLSAGDADDLMSVLAHVRTALDMNGGTRGAARELVQERSIEGHLQRLHPIIP